MPDERLEIDLDDELDLSGELTAGEPAPAKSKKTRTATGSKARPTPSETELRKRIDDGLEELVSVCRDFLGAGDVATAIETDKKRMADVLAAHAAKRQTVARVVVWLFGKDSALAAARAFGPTLRRVGGAWRARLEARRMPLGPEGTGDLEGWLDEQGVYHVGDERPAS